MQTNITVQKEKILSDGLQAVESISRALTRAAQQLDPIQGANILGIDFHPPGKPAQENAVPICAMIIHVRDDQARKRHLRIGGTDLGITVYQLPGKQFRAVQHVAGDNRRYEWDSPGTMERDFIQPLVQVLTMN